MHRDEGRRRLRFLLAAAGLVALIIGGWGISRSPLLDLDHVRIEGVASAQIAAVQSAVDLERGTPLFDLDLGQVDSAVESLPWVEFADVVREWPGTVRVTVVPRTPVAVVGTEAGQQLLIDAEGVLMGPATAPVSLPAIAIEPTVALGEVEVAAIGAIEVAVALPDDLRPWVEAVTVAPDPGADGRPIVGLDLRGNAVVELGAADLIEDKLAAVRSVLESVDPACIAVIDVAVADVPTITRDATCAAETPDDGSAEDA